MSSSDLLKSAAKQFGTKTKSEEQKKGSQMGTTCSENAGYVTSYFDDIFLLVLTRVFSVDILRIVAALSELAVLYFKLANPQAGNTYRKVYKTCISFSCKPTF